jgi:hypothetical protein
VNFRNRNTVEGMWFAFLIAFLLNGLAMAAGINSLYPTLATLTAAFFVRLIETRSPN